MTLTRRLTKGSSLTAAEHDGNIDHLADGANIKDAYEGEANTNAFTDALLSKLDAIEANATADQTGAEIIAAIDGEGRQIPTDAEFAAFLNDAAAFATAAQGALADTATQPGDNISTLTNDAGFVSGQTFTQGEKDKLAGLEDSLFLGVYTSLAALQAAHPSPVTGSYAHVDTGIGQDIAQYIWDDNDSLYVQAVGTGTADTASQVKTKYESNPDTNPFTDADQSKLAGIEPGATGDQTGGELISAIGSAGSQVPTVAQHANFVTAFGWGDHAQAGYLSDAGAFATAAQGALADTALQPGGNISTLTNDSGYVTGEEFTLAEKNKLAGVESGATGDQTGAEIKALYEAEANTNAFTDAEQSKLAGLEDSLFLGVYTSLAALQTAHPSPVVGSYAYVDTGVSQDITQYLWDDDDTAYVQSVGTGTADTPAQVKTKYESNANTNPLTDALLTKLNAIEDDATRDQTGAEIKTAYEGEPDTNPLTDARRDKLDGITELANPVQSSIPYFNITSGLPAYLINFVGMSIDDATNTLTVTPPTETFMIVLANVGDDLAAGSNVNYFDVPSQLNGRPIVDVWATGSAAGVTGLTTFQLRNATQATDILSTVVSIDSGEVSSRTAATQPVINPANRILSTDDRIEVNVPLVSTGTAPQGNRLYVTVGNV